MYCAEKYICYNNYWKEKAAVRVKGQMTDGPIAKNILLPMYKVSRFYHKVNDFSPISLTKTCLITGS